VSRAGLRPASLRRSQRSSGGSSGRQGGTTAPLSSAGNVPPMPPVPRQTALGISTVDLPNRTSMGKVPFFDYVSYVVSYSVFFDSCLIFYSFVGHQRNAQSSGGIIPFARDILQ
jgi:hypothetical protein